MPKSDADQELLELQRSQHTSGTVAGTPSADAVARDPNAVATWQARRTAQNEAHGQFVAAGDIHIGNALAFVAGMPVPLEHVIAYDLEALQLVYRVATPEMARVRKVFTDEEFQKANPHAVSRGPVIPEAHPAALDPRGGAAALDDERKAASKQSSSSGTAAKKQQGE